MMFLQRLFQNKAFLSALKVVGWVLLTILIISYVLAWISVLVWCLTHHIHHSTFTWFLVWTIWSIVGLTSVIVFMGVVDS